MTDFSEWKILKSDLAEKREEYSEVAAWCNEGGEYHIEEQGEYYAVAKNPEPTEEELKQRRIEELKSELSATDYKIIKCSECDLSGLPLPYDITELHATRQAIRDEINKLEG